MGGRNGLRNFRPNNYSTKARDLDGNRLNVSVRREETPDRWVNDSIIIRPEQEHTSFADQRLLQHIAS